jgi:hypothetical protein
MFYIVGRLAMMGEGHPATGACLQVESPFGIPRSFDLVIASDRIRHSCNVVWRADQRIGVAFCH